jgi:hypothetical protein
MGKSGRIRRRHYYTLEQFHQITKEIHGEKYDYSLVKQSEIRTLTTKFPVSCIICQHYWSTSIASHIKLKAGCPNCAKQIKWTYDRFITAAQQIHGDKYDYSKVTPDHIKNKRSKIPLSCKICLYNWNSSIDRHINAKAGCRNCAGNAPWTLSRLLMAAYKVHGEKYDYSRVTENHIHRASTRIPISCKDCGRKSFPTIRDHIHRPHQCPGCIRNHKWTYELFLARAHEIHGDRFDYSNVRPEHVQGVKSKVPLNCRICDYDWSPTIYGHIHSQYGCPNCAGKVKWVYQVFLDRAKEIHGDKFDYSQITLDQVHGGKSHVPISCRTCRYAWTPTVDGHINGKYGCPNCHGCRPWQYDEFLIVARDIHGDKFDYSNVTPDHIRGRRSRLPINCRTCQYNWNPTLNTHIHGKKGCPNCYGNSPWTLPKFLDSAKQIHGDLYDYSKVTDGHVKNAKSHVPIFCLHCRNEWSPSILSHIDLSSGCPRCRKSKGELACERALQKLQLDHKPQFVIGELPNRRYDNSFQVNGKLYLIEFDGRQHFKFISYFHDSMDVFLSLRKVDVIKTLVPLRLGHHIIRIDHTQVDNVEYHITQAICEDQPLYVSNPVLYSWIFESINCDIKIEDIREIRHIDDIENIGDVEDDNELVGEFEEDDVEDQDEEDDVEDAEDEEDEKNEEDEEDEKDAVEDDVEDVEDENENDDG